MTVEGIRAEQAVGRQGLPEWQASDEEAQAGILKVVDPPAMNYLIELAWGGASHPTTTGCPA